MPEPTLLSTANIGTTEGLIPTLGAGGKLASSLLPSIALTETLSVANAAARLALATAEAQGKIVIEADTGKSYGLVTAGNPATSGDWLQLGDRDTTAADITDSTAAGRALLLAANAAAQIEALGAETPAGAQSKADAAQAASARAIETKTANFTAVIGGRHITESGGIISITDPTGTTAGQSYEIWVGSGTIWFNGAGTVYSASRFSIRRSYNGSAWVTPSPVVTDALQVGATNTWNGSTFTGQQSFSSTSRISMPSVTGTPAATDVLNRNDGDTRYGGPIYDLDGSASHSESAATTPVKEVVLPVGTYLIEYGKLNITHSDTTSRTINININFTGGTATIQDRSLQAHAQAGNINGLTYAGQGATLANAIAITNASPSFGGGAHFFSGRIVVTAITTFRIFGSCSVTPTNPITYETSGILRKIA